MVLSILAAAVLAATGCYMIINGRYAATRRMSWIPLAMAAMELAMCGALDLTAYPLLTAILMLCRVTVLFCCHRVLKRDAAMERNRRRRRAVWRHIAATAPEACIVTGTATRVASRHIA
ncbi:MAG: hypothetical protein IKA63_02720 [Clostridia bacterium]|nr:hypothetical protein [Clostridia bacterium]